MLCYNFFLFVFCFLLFQSDGFLASIAPVTSQDNNVSGTEFRSYLDGKLCYKLDVCSIIVLSILDLLDKTQNYHMHINNKTILHETNGTAG